MGNKLFSRRGLLILCLAGLGLAAAATLGAPVMQFVFFLDLLTHFRAYWIPFLLLIAILLFGLGRRIAGSLAVVLAVYVGISVAKYHLGEMPTLRPGEDLSARILAFNVRGNEGDRREIARYLAEQNPDILLITEAKKSLLGEIRGIKRKLKFEVVELRSGAQGICLLSRYPIRNIDPVGLKDPRPYISAEVELPDGPIRFIGIHPSIPTSHHGFRARNEQFRAFAKISAESRSPVVLAGDFNSTPFSAHFQRILAKGNLKNACQGFGLQTTWERDVSMLPIDHVLVSLECQVYRYDVGPRMGSDHHPVLVDLKFPR